MMTHKFGNLIRTFLSQKPGLSQNKLAYEIGEDPAVISKMCHGKRLYGPLARQRIVNMITWFHKQTVLTTVVEANRLLETAGHAPLHPDDEYERFLLTIFSPNTQSQVIHASEIIFDASESDRQFFSFPTEVKSKSIPLILITGWIIKDVPAHKTGLLFMVWLVFFRLKNLFKLLQDLKYWLRPTF